MRPPLRVIPLHNDETDAMLRELARLRAENARAAKEVAELREAVAARDAFIAIAGHDLRNAMSGVVVAATNLRFRASRDPALPAWLVDRLQLLARHARGFVRRARPGAAGPPPRHCSTSRG
jgi:signal transduction histidine kinase